MFKLRRTRDPGEREAAVEAVASSVDSPAGRAPDRPSHAEVAAVAAAIADVPTGQVRDVPASQSRDVPTGQVRPQPAPELRGSKPSMLTHGMELKGEIRFAGPLHLEGTIDGLLAAPEVTVGLTGHIIGHAEATKLNLQGGLKGTARCGVLTLGASAVAIGTINCGSLTLARGAILEGRVAIGEPVFPAPEKG